MRFGFRASPGLMVFAVMALMATASHAEDKSYTLTIKDHKFSPDTLEIPAGQRVKVTVKNEDATPEEFDSDQLHREKVIAAGREGIVYIGPLDPGTYNFIGEYHADTAKGRIIVK